MGLSAVCIIEIVLFANKIYDDYKNLASEITTVPMTCNNKQFNKVYETCRRGIVDGMYETYKEHREDVNFSCDMMATSVACNYIN